MLTPLAAGFLALMLQLALFAALRPARPVGDEGEYLSPPSRPGQAPWVRVPLFAGFVRAMCALGGTPTAARLAMSGLSAITVGITTWQAGHLGGPAAGLIAGGLMLASLERMVLSLHIWPDTGMGLMLLLAATLLRDQPEGWPLALAVVGAVALGLRIEGAAIWALAVLAALTHTGADPGWRLAALAVSCLAPLAYVAWNRRRCGVWQLDTTFRFNLAVASRDRDSAAGQVADVMRDTLQAAKRGPLEVSATSVLSLSRLAARLRLLLGAETFASQVLIGRNSAGYSGAVRHLRWPPAWATLRYGFTVLFAAGLFVAPFSDPVSGSILVAAIGVYGLLVTRSRYRMALLPLLCVHTVTGWAAMLAEGTDMARILTGAVLVVTFCLLLRFAPRLDEIRG